MRILPIFCFLVLLLPAICLAQKTETNRYFNLFVAASGKEDGIYVYEFDAEEGHFTYKNKFNNAGNPSYLTLSKDGKYVYATSKGDKIQDIISSYSFDSSNGSLNLMNRQSSGGTSPSYVEVDSKNRFVFASNFGSGSVTGIPINADGTLNEKIQTIQYTGKSVNPTRQTMPHVHSVVISPDSNFVLTSDLGTDKIHIYHFDRNNSSIPLKPAKQAFIAVEAGSGPRHLKFHPNGKLAYVVQEITGLITVFDYNNGNLKTKQAISMIANGFTGEIRAADLHISPDGRFLYASNRGDADEIVIFSIGKSGSLTYLARQSSLGKSPRNFAIDPTGNFVLVANQSSNEIVIFKRDSKTGLLRPMGNRIRIAGAVCLKFAESPISNYAKFSVRDGGISMTIDANLGGRLTSLKLNNTEYLNQPVGSEKNFGSTFWLSPQDKWSGKQVGLNASPFKVIAAEESKISMARERDSLTGLFFKKEFSIQKADSSVHVVYTVTNKSKIQVDLAPWEVTRVDVGGLAFFPKGSYPALPKSNLEVKEKNGFIWYPFNEASSYTRQKLFMSSGENWLAHVINRRLLIKQFPHINHSDVAPGEGEIEIFSNKEKPFIELENQGRYQTLLPGESLTYKVKWFIRELPENIDPVIANDSLIKFVRSVIR